MPHVKTILFSFLVCLSVLFSQESNIVVTLDTEQTIHSIYFANLKQKDSLFPEEYMRNLEETLRFDMRYGGYSNIKKVQAEIEQVAHQNDVAKAFNKDYWHTVGVEYVLVPQVERDKFSIRIYDVTSNQFQEIHPLSISGVLREDRVLMHKISDLLHQSLYKVEGIAQKRILFAGGKEKEESGKWISEIWECGFDGNNLKQITSENDYSISPRFIPTALAKGADTEEYKFLYVCYKHGQPKIYLAENGARRGKPVVELRGNQLLPALSKKNDKLAFISDASGRADLFLQMFDPARGSLHKPMQIFSERGSVQASPCFSPDGTKLAFVSDKSYTPRIYVIDLLQVLRNRKRPELELISKVNRENTGPSWSPDGKKIVYSAKTNGVRQIWVYDLEKREERQLTTGQENKENPCFAADSLHIVYNTTSPTMELYLLDLNQLQPVKISHGPGKKHYPTWEP